MTARVIGILEAFGLVEEVGSHALTFDELLYVAQVKKRCGCRTIPSRMQAEDRPRIMELGKKCWQWKEANR